MMDNQLFDMLRERFDRQDADNAEIKEMIKEHTKKDELYWSKLDQHETQLNTLKKVGAGFISAVGLVEWFFRR